MNAGGKKKILGWLPYVIGAILVVQFFALSAWQIGRGIEKRAQQQAFSSQSGFAAWSNGMQVRSFQKLQVTGRLDGEHQFLLENIIINSRYGYYVLTPLVLADDEPVLLVNRGWFERSAPDVDLTQLAVPDETVTIRGRAGSLPRAGYRMGEAIAVAGDWPQRAVYPLLDELAAALGRDLQPFILLLDPEDKHGFFRHWVPEEMGPGRHYAYALQWFAMAIVLAGLLLWNFRKRGLES
ncbi:MAG: SURF1 family protein [Gammaproteobacteria bacterium]|nr:SURF1 family protein [Gammaproteobacteria bacterium]